MKRTLISITVFLAIQSCSPKIYPSRTETTDHTITVTETVHDTIIQVRPDSSIVQALIQCDSVGRAHIEEIRTLKESARIQQTLRIDNNLLTSRVKVDSMGIYLSYKERFKEDIKTETIETIIEKPVNYGAIRLRYTGNIIMYWRLGQKAVLPMVVAWSLSFPLSSDSESQ